MTSEMYTRHARDYDKAIADNIYNALLERPNMLCMLPELENKHVLDLGCGSGIYAQEFIRQGAKVTAVDLSQEMIDIVREKLSSEVKAYAADISLGLPQESDNTYDVVICPLAMHYVENPLPLFKEVKRVLKPSGQFFFSTHHPIADYSVSPSGNYFKRELITEKWDTIGHPVAVSYYRRPLSEWFEALLHADLHVVRFQEGRPDERMKTVAPDAYQKLSTRPSFIFFACKPNS